MLFLWLLIPKMLASFKKLFKFNLPKSVENKKNQSSLLLSAFTGLAEDILFWENIWLSLSFILFVNILFFVSIHEQVTFFQFLFAFCVTLTSIDALESWLKYKHRASFLKRLASYEAVRLNAAAAKLKYWVRRQWMELVYLREANHTKAFLLINIVLGAIFVAGKYINEYVLMYLICMLLCLYKKIAPPLLKFANGIQFNADSDAELENLIPEVTEADIKLLSIEPEKTVVNAKESLDYWKPNDLPLEDTSDEGSDNSSSIITHLPKEKIHSLERDIETSDSSEDEYIPLPLEKQKEHQPSTLQVVTDGTWGTTAYNAFFSLTGAMANMVYTNPSQPLQRQGTSPDSDSFEMIDKSELL